jgi:hypothetical protein
MVTDMGRESAENGLGAQLRPERIIASENYVVFNAGAPDGCQASYLLDWSAFAAEFTGN